MASQPPRFRPSYETCSEVSVVCPVSATTIGYAPNLGVNAFAAAVFALAAVSTLVIGIWKRTWGFSLAVAVGCILETAGYASRALLHDNVWQVGPFRTQITTIILAPTCLCAGLYLTLKHVVLAVNPELSRLSPRFYPWFFIPADVSCLVIQAIGGGIASASDNITTLNHANRTIIAGIVLQVIVLGVFGLIGGEYLWRSRKWILSGQAPEGSRGVAIWKDKKFKMFLCAIFVAYVLFFIRCVYRIAEMAGGWGNHIMQDEPSFIVLETFFILIGSALLAIFPPGIFFPQMSHSVAIKEGGLVKATGNESSGNEVAEKGVQSEQ